MGKEKCGLCVCASRDPTSEAGAMRLGSVWLHGTGCAEQGDGFTAGALPARGSLVVLLIGEMFKESQWQIQPWESHSAAAPHGLRCPYPA